MAALTPELYKWRWDYRVRQLFKEADPSKDKVFDGKVKKVLLAEAGRIKSDILNIDKTPLSDAIFQTRINNLADALDVPKEKVDKLTGIPDKKGDVKK